jgi:hypothetical protein
MGFGIACSVAKLQTPRLHTCLPHIEWQSISAYTLHAVPNHVRHRPCLLPVQYPACHNKLYCACRTLLGCDRRAVQARQLPLLAPVLPVKDPLLPSQAYDLVLQVSSSTVDWHTVQYSTVQYSTVHGNAVKHGTNHTTCVQG